MNQKNSSGTVDMLDRQGLTRKLIIFALPILACGVVQQSFNAVDIAVVGKYVGHEALAAVGANGPVISLLINLFMGLSLGSNVLIANYIGQRNNNGIRKAVSTSVILALVCGIGMLLMGMSVAGYILEKLDTPDNILGDATNYLRIFVIGFPGMMIFNFGSAIMRSIGDTKRAFYCLVVGGIVNVSLNLFFVIVLGMGVNGVAIATTISNYVSGVTVLILLMNENNEIHVNLKKLNLYNPELKKIIRIGLPAGIQGMVFALSNVFIQSKINTFGAQTISGSAAALNYELYCYFIIVAFTQAAIAFMGQNYGASRYDNCRRVYNRCMLLSLLSCAFFNLIIVLFHSKAIEIFTDNPDVIVAGGIRICAVLAFQFIACTYEIAGGALRAIGYSMLPMVITILGTCVLRVGWCWSFSWESYRNLLTIYPLTWIVTGIAMISAYYIIARKALPKRFVQRFK